MCEPTVQEMPQSLVPKSEARKTQKKKNNSAYHLIVRRSARKLQKQCLLGKQNIKHLPEWYGLAKSAGNRLNICTLLFSVTDVLSTAWSLQLSLSHLGKRNKTKQTPKQTNKIKPNHKSHPYSIYIIQGTLSLFHQILQGTRLICFQTL